MTFRITDYEGKNGQLYNGYQLLYTGDYNAAAKGLLKVELIHSTRALVTLPAVSSSFIQANEEVVNKINNRVVRFVGNSYATAASKFLADKEL